MVLSWFASLLLDGLLGWPQKHTFFWIWIVLVIVLAFFLYSRRTEEPSSYGAGLVSSGALFLLLATTCWRAGV